MGIFHDGAMVSMRDSITAIYYASAKIMTSAYIVILRAG